MSNQVINIKWLLLLKKIKWLLSYNKK